MKDVFLYPYTTCTSTLQKQNKRNCPKPSRYNPGKALPLSLPSCFHWIPGLRGALYALAWYCCVHVCIPSASLPLSPTQTWAAGNLLLYLAHLTMHPGEQITFLSAEAAACMGAVREVWQFSSLCLHTLPPGLQKETEALSPEPSQEGAVHHSTTFFPLLVLL